MATHTFNYALFIEQFPAFASAPSQATLQVYFNIATSYVDPDDNWCLGLNGNMLDFALNCLVAHQAQIANMIAAGQTQISIITSSSIDKISVGLMAPPVKNMFQYWLATTPYGQQLLALLKVQSVGGWSVSARLPERHAFRKVGGTFR